MVRYSTYAALTKTELSPVVDRTQGAFRDLRGLRGPARPVDSTDWRGLMASSVQYPNSDPRVPDWLCVGLISERFHLSRPTAITAYAADPLYLLDLPCAADGARYVASSQLSWASGSLQPLWNGHPPSVPVRGASPRHAVDGNLAGQPWRILAPSGGSRSLRHVVCSNCGRGNPRGSAVSRPFEASAASQCHVLAAHDVEA